MTNHDKNLDELAKKQGLESEKVVDYTEIEQGVDSQPRMSEVQTEDVKGSGKKKGKGKKGAKDKSTDKEPKTIKDKIRCSYCGNLMLQSSKLNWKEATGKKVPKGAEGKPVFKSPAGTAAGKVVGVFCDTCQTALDSGQRRDIKTAIVETTDGTVTNIPISDLPE